MLSCILWPYSRLEATNFFPIKDLLVFRNYITFAVSCLQCWRYDLCFHLFSFQVSLPNPPHTFHKTERFVVSDAPFWPNFSDFYTLSQTKLPFTAAHMQLICGSTSFGSTLYSLYMRVPSLPSHVLLAYWTVEISAALFSFKASNWLANYVLHFNYLLFFSQLRGTEKPNR